MSSNLPSSEAALVTFYYCFRSEMSSGRALRSITTEHRFWYSVAREIENQLQINAAARQNPNKRREQTFLQGQVVARCQAQVSIAAMREAMKTVPNLQTGSILDGGDILVVRRVPAGLYHTENSKTETSWQKHIVENDLKSSATTYEPAESLAARLRIEKSFIPLLRGIQHNFDPYSQAQRHKVLTVEEQLQNQEQEDECRINLQFTEDMTEDQRLALVSTAGTRMLSTASSANNTNSDDRRSNLGGDQKRKRNRYPPRNYVCKRCSIAGHWYSECPTHGDANFDVVNKIACTGIPKALLRRIDMPEKTSGATVMVRGEEAYQHVGQPELFDDLVHGRLTRTKRARR